MPAEVVKPIMSSALPAMTSMGTNCVWGRGTRSELARFQVAGRWRAAGCRLSVGCLPARHGQQQASPSRPAVLPWSSSLVLVPVVGSVVIHKPRSSVITFACTVVLLPARSCRSTLNILYCDSQPLASNSMYGTLNSSHAASWIMNVPSTRMA